MIKFKVWPFGPLTPSCISPTWVKNTVVGVCWNWRCVFSHDPWVPLNWAQTRHTEYTPCICLLGLLRPTTTRWWPRTVEIYSLPILEARSWKSRPGQGHSASEDFWGWFFLASSLLVVASNPWSSLDCKFLTLIYASTICDMPPTHVSVSKSLSYKDTSQWI